MTTKRPGVLSQLFRDMRKRINKKLFKKFELPWMKSKELDILAEVLNKLQPEYCFEWGSGYSTLYFPKHLNSIKLWYALEHNKDWFEYIKEKNFDERVKIEYVPPANFNFVKARGYSIQKEGTYEEFKDYVDFPSSLPVRFDFMFIDGRARKDCLRKAFDLISDNGVVMVHDSNRENYLEEIPPFKHLIRFKDYRKKDGGILIASKNRDLKTVLDIDGHFAAWKGHEILDKVLFKR